MLLNVGMVGNMLLAVAVIAVAFGAVPKFQFRIGYVCFTAYGTLMQIIRSGRSVLRLVGGGGELDYFGPSGVGSVLFSEEFLYFYPQGERDDVQNIFPEEQEVVGNGNQREQTEREGIGEYFNQCQYQVKHSKNPGFYRNNEKQQERGIGIKCCVGQEQTHIQVGYICPNIEGVGENQAENIHQNYAGEIEQIKPQCSPLVFNDPS